MLQMLDRIHPDVDTILICSDVPTLRYYIQTKLEKLYNVDKNYSMAVDTALSYKKVRGDAFVAPLAGDKWLVVGNADKIGLDTVQSLFNWGNGNCITLVYTEKYVNYKKLLSSEKFKESKRTILNLYLNKLDFDDVPYLYKDMVLSNPKSKRLTDDLLNFLCKNYRYDVERVVNLFSKMRIGLQVSTRQDIIDEIGLGGMTPASYTIDLLRLFQPTGRFAEYSKGEKITVKKIYNANKKYIGYLTDLGNKTSYNTIYNQMLSTLKGILEIKMLIMNGKYRKNTKEIPESFSPQQVNRIRSLQRFDMPIREEISLNRVLLLLNIFEHTPQTFDYELRLITIISEYISLFEGSIDTDDN